jgi:hypothetical protein
MEVFTRNVHWTAGLNPVAELHLAPGERSRRPKKLLADVHALVV